MGAITRTSRFRLAALNLIAVAFAQQNQEFGGGQSKLTRRPYLHSQSQKKTVCHLHVGGYVASAGLRKGCCKVSRDGLFVAFGKPLIENHGLGRSWPQV